MLAINRWKITQVFLVLLMVVGCFTIIYTQAGAQIGGDFRNTTLNIGKGMDGDVSLFVQTDNQGMKLMVGGVTVVEGDKVSFDIRARLATDTAGFWKAQEGNNYKVLFWNEKGEKSAIIEIRGLVRWDKTRNVTQGAENFLRIETLNDPGKYIKITNQEFVNGRLILTTEEGGRFSIYNLSPDPSGTIATFEK